MGSIPDGMMTVVAFLSLGYLLFAVEMIVPGGVLGVLGVLSVLYGCWVAFQMGFIWGSVAILASLIFFVLVLRFFFHSRTGRSLTLSNEQEARAWKSNREDWQGLLGQIGITHSALRPAGVVVIGGERYDVVSDNEFLEANLSVRVTEVEGRRIVVEPVEPIPESGPEDSAPESGPEDSAPESIESQSATMQSEHSNHE